LCSHSTKFLEKRSNDDAKVAISFRNRNPPGFTSHNEVIVGKTLADHSRDHCFRNLPLIYFLALHHGALAQGWQKKGGILKNPPPCLSIPARFRHQNGSKCEKREDGGENTYIGKRTIGQKKSRSSPEG